MNVPSRLVVVFVAGGTLAGVAVPALATDDATVRVPIEIQSPVNRVPIETVNVSQKVPQSNPNVNETVLQPPPTDSR